MINDKRPLFTLTVQEYIELNRSLHKEVPKENTVKNEVKEERDIVYLEEAAAITGYTDKTIYTKVSRRELPVVSYFFTHTAQRMDIKGTTFNCRNDR